MSTFFTAPPPLPRKLDADSVPKAEQKNQVSHCDITCKYRSDLQKKMANIRICRPGSEISNRSALIQNKKNFFHFDPRRRQERQPFRRGISRIFLEHSRRLATVFWDSGGSPHPKPRSRMSSKTKEDEAAQSDVAKKKEDEEEEDVGQVCLTEEMIAPSLSQLCKTANGLNHAFVILQLQDKGLTEISLISRYVHLRFLDLTNNHLTDLSPLKYMTHLLWLKVDNNALESFRGQPFMRLKFLQWLSIAENQLTDIEGLIGNSLENLNLTGNRIQNACGLKSELFAHLTVLELRGNQLESTYGIELPNLQHLYLAQNFIKRLEGLDKLERLNTLHLRDNQLESLDGISRKMKCLLYLNVRGNIISKEASLKSLSHVSKSLKVFLIMENPLVHKPEHRMAILTLVPNLERIDKTEVTPEDKAIAMDKIKETKGK